MPLASTLFDRALRFALNLSIGKQIALAITAFGYAVLMGSEGVELYEIHREAHPVRVIVLLANIAIVGYLFKRKELFECRSSVSWPI